MASSSVSSAADEVDENQTGLFADAFPHPTREQWLGIRSFNDRNATSPTCYRGSGGAVTLCSHVRQEWGSQDSWHEKNSAFAMERLTLGSIN